MDGVRGSDLFVGAAIGAVGGLNNVALPGLLLVGLGFDLSIAIAYKLNPAWFPHSTPLTWGEVLTTSIGTAAGWAVTKAFVPHGNPEIAPIAAAGLGVIPINGRMPGRMRHATYRWNR